MIRTFIIECMPIFLATVIILYISVKFYLIISKGLGAKLVDLFFVSLAPLSKQAIRNTFQERVKQYYKISNKINIAFYIVFGAAVLLYILMLSI